jgi:dihydroorotase
VVRHSDWRNVESSFRATDRLLRLARQHGKKVHVLHVTTAEEMQLLKKNKDLATVEVTPQHLTLFAPDCYERLGSFAQMNPPIREKSHQQALWSAITDGTVDVIGSDHAPHTREEKAKTYPGSPSGMPGVQTLLPLMLDHVANGKLSIERLVQLTSENAARIFSIKDRGSIEIGCFADLSIVDLKRRETITRPWLKSRCDWSPFEGQKVQGWPVMTVINGAVVMREAELLIKGSGHALIFEKGN